MKLTTFVAFVQCVTEEHFVSGSILCKSLHISLIHSRIPRRVQGNFNYKQSKDKAEFWIHLFLVFRENVVIA